MRFTILLFVVLLSGCMKSHSDAHEAIVDMCTSRGGIVTTIFTTHSFGSSISTGCEVPTKQDEQL